MVDVVGWQVGVLEGSSFEWLLRMLQAFEAGDLAQYDALCRTYSQQLNAQPALVANQNRLREKITILCLLNLIFSCVFTHSTHTRCHPHRAVTHT